MNILYLVDNVIGGSESFIVTSLSEGGKYPVISTDMYSNKEVNKELYGFSDAEYCCEFQLKLCMESARSGWWTCECDPRLIHKNTTKLFVINPSELMIQRYCKLAKENQYTVCGLNLTKI